MTLPQSSARLPEALVHSVLFKGLPLDALQDIARRFRPLFVPAGTICCAEGQPGEEMYIIESGRFFVDGRVGTQQVRFAELGPGDLFGEMALVTGQPRSATVTAASQARIWALGRADFAELARSYPSLSAGIERIVSERTTSLGRARLANERTMLFSLGQGQGNAVTIGRAASNTIVLDHPTVSRHHAVIQPMEQTPYIVDLNSSNGVFINGARVRKETPLRDGDRIQIGPHTIYFERSMLSQFSRGGGIKVDGIALSKVVGKGLTILRDVSLSIYPGELVCIVGGSGAGKTTLLDALNGFRPATRGQVMYNGQDFYENFELYRHSLGYVPQDDIVHPELTVHQTFYYAARLRLPSDTSRAEIDQIIGETLASLDLTQRRDTEVRQLSGGQRKRVSIGVELLTKPDIFFLDEPTSGLDPGLDGRMMELLRQLADEGRTVILTTHATKNVMLCNKVVFMARGGQLVFFGAPGDALKYFEVDDFTDIYRRLESEDNPEVWEQRFRQSEYYQRHIRQRIEGEMLRSQPASSSGKPVGQGKAKGANWFAQLVWLSLRFGRILTRDKIALGVLMAAAPLIALVMTQTFSQDTFALTFAEGGDAREGIALLFYMAAASIFLGGFVAARSIAEEKAIYARERLINLGLFPYVTSKVCVLGLFSLIQSALLVGIVALKIDFPGDHETLVKLFAILALSNVAAVALGLVVSALSSNGLQATLILVVLIIPQLILSGAVVALDRVGEAARYLSDTMISRWSLSLLGYIVDVNTRINAQLPRNDFSEQFDIDPVRYVLILVGLFALFFAGALAALKSRDVR